MAKKTSKVTNTNNYEEFNVEGTNGNSFNGRIYPMSNTTDNAEIYPLSITVNGLAIVGCKFIDGKRGAFVSFPSYKAKDGEYKQQCYFYNKEDMEDMSELAEILKGIVIEMKKVI